MRRVHASGLLLAILLVFSACGSEDPASSETEDQNTETQAPDGGDGAAIEVEAFDFGFEPATISVDAGEEVTINFSNTGEAPHTFTSDDLEIDISASAGGDGSATFTAPEDGTYAFQCSIHPDQMSGEVIVGTGGAGAGSEDTKEGGSENDDGLDY